MYAYVVISSKLMLIIFHATVVICIKFRTIQTKNAHFGHSLFDGSLNLNYEWWALRGSNPRPPRCKRGALAN